MNSITWLHLSDWHQKGAEFNLDRDKVFRALLTDIKERAKIINRDLAAIDFIVFSGDVAFCGKREEYRAAADQFFIRILNAAGIGGSGRLFIVPGNHDLDRKAFKYLPPPLLQPFNPGLVQEWLMDEEGLADLLSPFKEYSYFGGSDRFSPQKAYAYLGRYETGSGRVALICLNSALLSGRHKEIQNGEEVVNDDRYLIVGEPQIHDLLYDERFLKADVRIVVMHHPFDWLAEFERDLIRDQLTKNCHFILHGHEHRPKMTFEDGTGGNCVIIPAGSSYERREPLASRYANGYNFVHLDFASGTGTVYFRRYDDRQGWINDTGTTGDETPGYRTFTLPKELGGARGTTAPVSNKTHTEQEQIEESRRRKNETDRGKLRQAYMAEVCKQYGMLPFRGLAPEATKGVPELPLSEIYVELKFMEGLEQLPEFEARKPEESPAADIQDGESSEDLPAYSGKGKLTRFELIKPEKIWQEVSRPIVDIWDGMTRGMNIILGEAGAGKTVTVRALALALAGEGIMEVIPQFAGYLPIVGSLAKYSRRTQDDPDIRLEEHLCTDQNPDFSEVLVPELEAGKCVVLLDGLDETRDPRRVMDAIQDFTKQYANNYIVITSREDAYRLAGVDHSAKHLVIKRMDDPERDHFIERWYQARGWVGEPGPDHLKGILDNHPKLADLVRNPLLLTIIIQMHWGTETLPSKPVKVYQTATDTLIKYWREHRYRISTQEPSIEDLNLEEIKDIMKPIAYAMLWENGLIGEDDLRLWFTKQIKELKEWEQSRVDDTCERWLNLITEKSGLLICKGIDKQTKKRVFGFLHRRFAEYLAASHMRECSRLDRREYLKCHIHTTDWNEVILLFAALSEDKLEAAEISECIRGLNSPYEETVWRDHLLAAQCLGEGVLIAVGPLRDSILSELSKLLTDERAGLRAKVVNIFTGLSGTPYQDKAINLVSRLAKNELPWSIRCDVAETLFKLGEYRQSHELLVELREVADGRRDYFVMTQVIEWLLKGWERETLDWLIIKASEYKGRGIEVWVYADWKETAVVAADESFGAIHVGRYLSKPVLEDFVERLRQVLVFPEQQERLHWVQCQLERSADEIEKLATNGCVERVRQLAAEWLVKHGARRVGVPVLEKLATQGDGNLHAVDTLKEIGKTEEAIYGAKAILIGTLDIDQEQMVAFQLAKLGMEEEAATILIEMLLSEKMTEEQDFDAAEALSDIPLAHEIGLAALQMIASSIQHLYRYEAAVTLGKMGKMDLEENKGLDLAYQVLLDIAERWGVIDRVNAVISLKDTRFIKRLERDALILPRLARHVVDEVSDGYRTYTKLLKAGIEPAASSKEQVSSDYNPKITREVWKNNAKEARNTFCKVAEKWLGLEGRRTHPYAQVALAYLRDEKEKDQANDVLGLLQKATENIDASASLLLRAGEQALKLKALDTGLQILNRVLDKSTDKIKARTLVALTLQSFDEHELALKATREIATIENLKFQDRQTTALLLSWLGQTDESTSLLIPYIEAEVPRRSDWLRDYEISQLKKVRLTLATYLSGQYPRFAYAFAVRAETLRQLKEYNEAIGAADSAIALDERYSWAWGVKGNTLGNMGQRDEAIRTLNQAVKLDPNYGWAYTYMAELHRQVGHYQDALNLVRKACDLYERNSWYWAVYSETLENMGQREDALAKLNRVIELNPQSSWARAFKAETLRRLGRYNDALAATETALEIDKGHPLAWKTKCEILASMDQYSEALDILINALDSEDKRVRSSAIKALAEIGDSQAIDLLMKSLDDPEHEVRKSAISTMGKLGTQRATEELLKALTDDDSQIREAVIDAFPEPIDARVRAKLLEILKNKDSESVILSSVAQVLGRAADESIVQELANLQWQDNEEEAKAAAIGLALTGSTMALSKLQSIIERWSDVAIFHSMLGYLLQRLGQFSEALCAHETAIGKKQSEAGLYFLRGLTYSAWAQSECAVADFETAIALDPDEVSFWSGLGCAWFEQKEDDKALLAWWRAKSIAEGNATVFAELAVGLWVTGDNENHGESLRLWQRARRRDPRFGQDLEWMQKERAWGPRMIEVAKELWQVTSDI